MSEHSGRESKQGGYTRRSFLKGAGTVAAGGAVAQSALATPAGATATEPDVPRLSGDVDIRLQINGIKQVVRCQPRTTLLSALRHYLPKPLTGAKEVCDQGACGACTVLIDDEPVCACLTLAVDAQNKPIRTVEGLADGDRLSHVQEAFIEHDALMCGFCTSGFLMSVTSCLEKQPDASVEEIKSGCSGNLCRCGTYPHIFEAARAAGRRMQSGGKR